MGKKSLRKDGKGQKSGKYVYLQWKEAPFQGAVHTSHTSSNYKGPYKSKQKVPGHCLLCPRQFFGGNEREMTEHWQRVHFKHSIDVANVKFLLCKCSEVPNRGTDDSIRNRHYHCIICWKPCENKFALSKHSITRHNLKGHLFRDLLEKKK